MSRARFALQQISLTATASLSIHPTSISTQQTRNLVNRCLCRPIYLVGSGRLSHLASDLKVPFYSSSLFRSYESVKHRVTNDVVLVHQIQLRAFASVISKWRSLSLTILSMKDKLIISQTGQHLFGCNLSSSPAVYCSLINQHIFHSHLDLAKIAFVVFIKGHTF